MNHKRFMVMLVLSLIMLFAVIPQVLASDEGGITTTDIIALVEQFEDEG